MSCHEDNKAIRRMERRSLPPELRDELRAQQWADLAALAHAIADRCEGAALFERRAPQAGDTFREIEFRLRGQLEAFTASFEEVLDDRKADAP